MFFSCRFLVAVLLLGLTLVGQAQEVNSRWNLRVMDLKHKVRVDATVRFLAEPATESCIGGTWKRVVVEAKSAQDEQFFSLADQLSYELETGELTLGRTKVCDGYLFLSGRSGKSPIRGTYVAVGIGAYRKLGYFTLRQLP